VDDKECGEAREDEVVMDLVDDQEYSSSISGNIRNQVEKDSLEEENEAPQIKETCPKVSGTIPKSPTP
jgi:hypothetical protein